jgi:hypothetical protein
LEGIANCPRASVVIPDPGRERNPAPQKEKGIKMPSKYAQTTPQTKNRASPNLPVTTLRPGRIKAGIWEKDSDS